MPGVGHRSLPPKSKSVEEIVWGSNGEGPSKDDWWWTSG